MRVFINEQGKYYKAETQQNEADMEFNSPSEDMLTLLEENIPLSLHEFQKKVLFKNVPKENSGE